MAKPSYRSAVEWIAHNDECAETDPEVMAGLISVVLVASLWSKSEADVAADVLAKRKRFQAPA